jgi:enoyl-CoA hydratase
MTPLVSYELDGAVATIAMDDGKVNALSLEMLAELGAALDRAETDRAVVVLTGRDGVFSAGFHLPTLTAGGTDAVDMLRGGFELCARLLAFPTPVLMACSGHAMAAGLFVLLSGDYRIAVVGPYKIIANEVAIGLTLPYVAIEVMRLRLTPAAFQRAAVLAEQFAPDDAAIEGGLVDRVVPAAALGEAARSTAEALAALDFDAHLASKLRVRADALEAIRAAIEADGFGRRV